MARLVVILGAGASADFGVPTLSNIFKDHSARRHLIKRPELLEMLNTVFWSPRGHSLDTSDQSLNIEQMLTILKDWEMDRQLPKELKPKNADTFRKGLKVLIYRAVFENKSSKGKHLNPLIDICRKKFDHTTWASFNWDCIFESSFWYSQPLGTRINPKLAIDVQNWHYASNKHTYLKLHGGINWWLIDNQIRYLQWTPGGELQQKWREYESNPDIMDRPVILEPSFYKYQDISYKQLAPQWETFSDDLRKADYVLVLGYSLPEMDVNSRSRILTAFQVCEECKWLVVDPSESVCNLYSRLLGRERVKILPMTLSGFNNDIETNLSDAFPDMDFSM
jgi:hypothetical protein